ncbi:hypothetical protein PssB301D_05200 [Pseudomonas syringae pv. syringae str. B301D-R]|nr:hypothetical protein PsyrB_19700 [Pseudomonas syringae pv. syringae B301D]EXL28609.1 hypothetical protein PssB301D_05200 [Pseudomonas syringae pv. syringae str. B301D-R]
MYSPPAYGLWHPLAAKKPTEAGFAVGADLNIGRVMGNSEQSLMSNGQQSTLSDQPHDARF